MRRALAWLIPSALVAAGVGLAGHGATATAQGDEAARPEGAATEAAATGGAGAEAGGEAGATDRDGPAQAVSPEARARREQVVARVGDVRITLGDVEDAINEQSPFMRARYRNPEQVRAMAESMLRFELLARAAERAGTVDPEIRHTTRQNAVQHLVRQEFDEGRGPSSVPDADIAEYYRTHPEEFIREEMRRASHVRVATRAEAEALLEEARAADARGFRSLATQRSSDPETRLRGGDLRYFDVDGRARNARDPRVHEAIAHAAFDIEEIGQVVGPVEVEGEFSLVKLTGRRPGETRSLAQATPTIRLRLWRERRQQAMEDFVTRLRREANVQLHPERIGAIRLDPAPREDQPADPHGAGRPLSPRPVAVPGVERVRQEEVEARPSGQGSDEATPEQAEPTDETDTP